MVGDNVNNSRDIVIEKNDKTIKKITATHPLYDALQ